MFDSSLSHATDCDGLRSDTQRQRGEGDAFFLVVDRILLPAFLDRKKDRTRCDDPIPERKSALDNQMHKRRSIASWIVAGLHKPRNDVSYTVDGGTDNDNFDDNLCRTGSVTSHNVINFNDHWNAKRLQRLSARNSNAHPSTFRSVGRRRLGGRDRMARIELSTRRSFTDWLQGTIPDRVAVTLGLVLEDRIDTRSMGRPASEHQSRSESVRRIRQTTLDSINNNGGKR